MKFTITDNPKKQDIEEIRNHLLEYNLNHLECKLVKPIAIFVTDENGSKLGGITGETHGNWLKIDFLWVNEKSGLVTQRSLPWSNILLQENVIIL